MKLLSRLLKRRAQPEQPGAGVPRCLSYQCAPLQGQGARERQEDAWTLVNHTDVTMIRKEGLLALVADGMGGMNDGALASATGIRIMSEDFRQMDRSQPLGPQLVKSLRNAADEVCGALKGYGGSTVIACLIHGEKLHYAGVGDSYLYLLRRGMLLRINREQNVLHQRYLRWIRDGRVDTEARVGVSQPQAITSFLGAKPLNEVDSLHRPMPLESGDVLLLCSDGIGGVVPEQEILDCLSLGDANASAAALHQAVLDKRRPHQDNFTGIVIVCQK